MTRPVQLLVYRFAPGAGFEGRLVGALERIESGGALRVLDVLFVASDADTAEVFALDLHGGGAGGMVSSLLSFRLDVHERRRMTARVRRAPGGQADLIMQLGETLQPGHALAAVLVAHEWAHVLNDAVERTGGTALADAFVAPTSLTELSAELVAAVQAG